MISKYTQTIKDFGCAVSPKMVRDKLNEDGDPVTASQVAASLHSLKKRKKINQLPNGLYEVANEAVGQ